MGLRVFSIEELGTDGDLGQIVDDINQATWDDSNEMSVYQVQALLAYLQRQDTRFVTCYEVIGERRVFVGMASARLEIKPYDHEHWLYVDEVDVCVDQRQKGAGKAMMEFLIDMAKAYGCTELWLGTEVDNVPANALYRSLDPDEELEFVGYNYEFEGN